MVVKEKFVSLSTMMRSNIWVKKRGGICIMFEPENVTKEQFLAYLENGIDSLEILVTHNDNGTYMRN